MPSKPRGRIAISCLLALPLLALGASAADLPDIEKTGRLRALVVKGSPAFYSLAQGGEPGLDREVLDGFARLRKLKLETVPVASWAELLPALLEGRGDVIAGGVTVTPARREKIDFSAEVMPTRHVAVSRRPTPPIQSLDQLKSLRVGTVRGSSMAEVLTAVGVKGFDETVPSGGAPEALRSGRIAATVSGIEDALLYRREDPAIQIGMFVGPAGSLAFGVRKDAPQLRRALDDYVGNLRRTPTWSRLVVKYFGEVAPELLKKARSEE